MTPGCSRGIAPRHGCGCGSAALCARGVGLQCLRERSTQQERSSSTTSGPRVILSLRRISGYRCLASLSYGVVSWPWPGIIYSRWTFQDGIRLCPRSAALHGEIAAPRPPKSSPGFRSPVHSVRARHGVSPKKTGAAAPVLQNKAE